MRRMGLHNTNNISLKGKLAIFLYASVTGMPAAAHLAERFQRPEEAISRHFSDMVIFFSGPPFYTAYMHLPTANDPCPPEIRGNKKYFPFFKDALGIIGGNFIPFSRSAQNLLVACTLSSRFLYIICGSGGSDDLTLYQEARSADLIIPEGKYYLADFNLPSCDGLLTPYRRVRYHLADWARAGVWPANKEELFNFRHASARSVIEPLCGVWNQNYRILQAPHWSSVEIHVRIPAALCALHNFIRKHETDEEFLDMYVEHGRIDDGYYVDVKPIPEEDGDPVSARRDTIAQSMWEDYMRRRTERGAAGDEDIDETDEYNSPSDEMDY